MRLDRHISGGRATGHLRELPQHRDEWWRDLHVCQHQFPNGRNREIRAAVTRAQVDDSENRLPRRNGERPEVCVVGKEGSSQLVCFGEDSRIRATGQTEFGDRQNTQARTS